MPGKDSKYIEFTKWTNRGRGTMGEFKFKDTVENLKTNLLDNLGLWVPTAIAANGIINGIIAYIFVYYQRRLYKTDSISKGIWSFWSI